VVPSQTLDDTAWEMANKIALAPMVAVKMARRVLQRLREPAIRSSMGDEMIYQTFINKSSDFAEFKAARSENRKPGYTGS
jgi:enoyl-CoA hydratase/carnithine racemase